MGELKSTNVVFDGFPRNVSQAEDGIRDRDVTGVQTCALPIFCGFFFLWIFLSLSYFYLLLH